MARGLTCENAADAWTGKVLQDIDWSRPWFVPWGEPGTALVQDAVALGSVAQALNRLTSTSGDDPVVFVPQSELPAGLAYEDFIFQQRRVPTRDGLHDFFNGLCWHRFPHAKRRLNALQAGEIARNGIRGARGPVRDALTLFDENAVLLQAPDVLWQALQERDWVRLCVDLREAWRDVHLVLFGHALLEKLVQPYKSITGHVYRIDAVVDARDDAALDAWLAEDLQAAKLATKPFEPLPVLGVPGWWADSDVRDFYMDSQVFRPRREKP